jgi:hypothetical protein
VTIDRYFIYTSELGQREQYILLHGCRYIVGPATEPKRRTEPRLQEGYHSQGSMATANSKDELGIHACCDVVFCSRNSNNILDLFILQLCNWIKSFFLHFAQENMGGGQQV